LAGAKAVFLCPSDTDDTTRPGPEGRP